MISPGKMKIIQVEITNNCIHHCSNCTRFCGLHEKTFSMSFEQFKTAVDSLKDFKGIVGVMGGEPTLNPHFSEMIEYLGKVRPSGRRSAILKAPEQNFNGFHKERWNNLTGARRGLWSALGSKYYENLEAIADIFPYQCLNDHKNSGMHQALLIPRKELGISDEEFFALRDKCWIQNEWSASITPKGAFFCEVAAALDMLFDGPGGWPVEPGWWKRSPDEFGDQLYWCEFCSAALAVPSIAGNMETEIISPGIWEKLKGRKAWKVIHNRCSVFDTSVYNKEKYSLNYDGEPYLSDEDIRVSQDTGKSLFPHDIAVLLRNGAKLPSGEKFHVISEEMASSLQFRDWLLVLDKDISDETAEFMTNAVFNPGVFYYAEKGAVMFFNRRASALKNIQAAELKLKSLKKLFSSRKRYHWKNWRTPERKTWREGLEVFLRRIQDCWCYRCGLILKKMGLSDANV